MESLMARVEEQRDFYKTQNESEGKLIIKLVQDYDIVYKIQMQNLEREVAQKL